MPGDLARPAAVEARGWGWRHGGRRTPAISGLDLRIEPGERVLLLGASGSGKSTLLHAMAGVLGGDDEGDEVGTLVVDGVPPAHRPGRSSLVLQDPDAQVVMSRIGDDVAFGLENLGVPRERIWPRVEAALAAVGLRFPLDHPTSRLSGGERQRLALAGVLAMRPGLVLLDEPTANLDPDGVLEVRDAVAATVADRAATLVVVEHRVAVWADVVDRVVVLGRGGGLIADGTPAAVLGAESARLREAGVWLPNERMPRRVRPADTGAAASGTDPLVVADRISLSRDARAVVRSDVSARVDAGRILAVTGPNGVGKSTLALTLGGLLRPASGELRASTAFARGAAAEPWRWKSRELLTRIGTVFQNPEHQFLAATVRQELEIGPHALRLDAAEIRRRSDALLDALRLSSLEHANPFTLSGGEQRRLSVATALAARPRMLVLDEPTFGQDANTWRALAELIGELRDEGVGIVAVTHDAEFVEAIADVELVLGEASRSLPVGGAS